MASLDGSPRKSFTVIWKVENLNYGWFDDDYIESPEFTVDEISKTKWKLILRLDFFRKDRPSQLCLVSMSNENGPEEEVKIVVELGFIFDGKVLGSFELHTSGGVVWNFIPSWNEISFYMRSISAAQDVLIVRCRMWKSIGDMFKNVLCVARTRLVVEKRSTLWNIENFSGLESDEKRTLEITSLDSDEKLMTLKFWLIGSQVADEGTTCLEVIPNYYNLKVSVLQLSIVDVYNKAEKYLQAQFADYEDIEGKQFTPIYTKRDLVQKRNTYLPNDILSLLCQCNYSTGKFEQEIEYESSDIFEIETHNKKNVTAKEVLAEDFKSMFINRDLADVKVKTRSKTYPAHKIILAARSSVFKSMFSTNMKENISDCVNIEDLNDETVLEMLWFIYSAEVEELDWDRAIHLYEAADKYQILNLKDICRTFLKANVRSNYACEALVLADMHQDDDLKRFVQDFILKNVEEIAKSEEWMKLMETHLKLAAETMYLKFKVK